MLIVTNTVLVKIVYEMGQFMRFKISNNNRIYHFYTYNTKLVNCYYVNLSSFWNKSSRSFQKRQPHEH